MSRHDLEYYRRRAITERELARAACLPKVAAVHLEMAERYEALVRDGTRSNVVSIRAVGMAAAA